jgi:hypothetical protein
MDGTREGCFLQDCTCPYKVTIHGIDVSHISLVVLIKKEKEKLT